MAVANAHMLGATPWGRADYIGKFRMLTEGVLDTTEAERFLEVVQRLPSLRADELIQLNISIPAGSLEISAAGLF